MVESSCTGEIHIHEQHPRRTQTCCVCICYVCKILDDIQTGIRTSSLATRVKFHQHMQADDTILLQLSCM